jgi:hypothetical protein
MLCLGLTSFAFALLVLAAESGVPPTREASAQECVSEALPVQAPAPPQAVDSAAHAPARLPATGNAGLLGPRDTLAAVQDCPTPEAAPPTAVPSPPTPTVPTPTATSASTPIGAPNLELPGGDAGEGGLTLPPGAISY